MAINHGTLNNCTQRWKSPNQKSIVIMTLLVHHSKWERERNIKYEKKEKSFINISHIWDYFTSYLYQNFNQVYLHKMLLNGWLEL